MQLLLCRWKETFFVNSNEACGLTIAGFYYSECRPVGRQRGDALSGKGREQAGLARAKLGACVHCWLE